MRVKLLGSKGKANLIEWASGGKIHRAFVPDEYLIKVGDEYECAYPDHGIGYGVNWREVSSKIVTPAELALIAESIDKELKRVGIWTYEEAKAKPQLVTTAIQTAVGLTARSLIAQAKDYLEKDHGND